MPLNPIEAQILKSTKALLNNSIELEEKVKTETGVNYYFKCMGNKVILRLDKKEGEPFYHKWWNCTGYHGSNGGPKYNCECYHVNCCLVWLALQSIKRRVKMFRKTKSEENKKKSKEMNSQYSDLIDLDNYTKV